MARLSELQTALVAYIKQQGGAHVYLGRSFSPPVGSGLTGYTWEGVSRSLRSLLRRGVLRAERGAFFYLVDESR